MQLTLAFTGPGRAAWLPRRSGPVRRADPAQIKADQAVKFSEALLRGEPNRIRIALTAAGDTVRQII